MEYFKKEGTFVLALAKEVNVCGRVQTTEGLEKDLEGFREIILG